MKIRCLSLILPMLLISYPLLAEDNFTWLKHYIYQAKAKTLDDALKKLPSVFKKNYVLVHASRATAPSTLKRPRVIMYGKGARLVIAFNPSQETLEVMDYDSGMKQFRFHEIDFSKRNSRPVVRENNQQCLGCHREGVPLWDLGELRPGVYGSESPAYKERLGAELKDFLMNKGQHESYRHLSTPEEQDLLNGFKKRNELLGRLFWNMNIERMERVLREKSPEKLSRITPLIIADTIGCRNLSSFLSINFLKDLQSHFDEKVVPKLLEHHQRSGTEFSIMGGHYRRIDTALQEQVLKRNFWNYLKESLLDHMFPYQFRLLHTGLTPEDYYFTDGTGGLNRLGQKLMKGFPEIKNAGKERACRMLQKKSLELL